MDKKDRIRKQIEQMNCYYEARAPWHDQYMSYESNERMEEFLKPTIDVIEEMLRDKRILEIACGTGNWTEVLAKRAASIVAIDISPSALAIARSKLSDYSNVAFLEGDAYSLDNTGDSFEVLFSADWWSHIPKGILPAFLDSALSKLLPGSEAIFTDMTLFDYFKREPCRYDDDNNRLSLRTLPDGSQFEVIKNFPNESEIRHILLKYGDAIAYHEFCALDRWMVILTKA